MSLLQSEPDKTRELWSDHPIRFKVQNSECPADRLDVLYHLLSIPDAQNFSFDVSEHDVKLVP